MAKWSRVPFVGSISGLGASAGRPSTSHPAHIDFHTGGRVIGPLLGSHEAALPLVHAVAPDGAATLKAIGAPADILVEPLTSAGFEIAVEQVSMSFGGHALPGKRELYLALMHPTLG